MMALEELNFQYSLINKTLGELYDSKEYKKNRRNLPKKFLDKELQMLRVRNNIVASIEIYPRVM
jgi:hypothetical protein